MLCYNCSYSFEMGQIFSYIYFIYGIEFMSFVYLVVYIGAIAILFLFVIMMLNINCINSLPNKASISLSFLYACLFFKCIYFIFLVNKKVHKKAKDIVTVYYRGMYF